MLAVLPWEQSQPWSNWCALEPATYEQCKAACTKIALVGLFGSTAKKRPHAAIPTCSTEYLVPILSHVTSASIHNGFQIQA